MRHSMLGAALAALLTACTLNLPNIGANPPSTPGAAVPAASGGGATAAPVAAASRTISWAGAGYASDGNGGSNDVGLYLNQDGTFQLSANNTFLSGNFGRLTDTGSASGSYKLVGDTVTLEFADGSTATGQLVPGTDGHQNLVLDGATLFWHDPNCGLCG